MERKKPAPPSSSSSDEGSSSEEEESEQGFVRSDRKTTKFEDIKPRKPAAAEEGEEEDDEEDDGDDGGVDDTQRSRARADREAASSSDTTQAGHGDEDSDSSSETSSASAGKPGKPSHQFVVVPHKLENVNGHGKRTPTSEKPSKVRPAPEVPKKTKDKASKRDRDTEPQERGSSKKQKKESSTKPSKTEKVSKEKNTPSHTSEKKTDAKKSLHVAVVSEDPKPSSPKHPENASAKKAADKSRKATKDAELDPSKGSVSPSKPKVFPPKDELVLTTAILHDINEGIGIPVKKVDGYWDTLLDRVKVRMEGSWSKEQLCDKVKRMKVRYMSMADKFKDSAERKFRNSTDRELYGLWDQIWGNGEARNGDHEREVSEAKEKQLKVSMAASPVRGGKAARKKVAVAPIQGNKLVHEESEGAKSKQVEEESSDEDDDDSSESGESTGERDLHIKPTTPMEVDKKGTPADHALIPKVNAVQVHEVKVQQSHSTSDSERIFQEEVRATLLELQESSKQALKEWQRNALAVVENAVKAAADQSRFVNGIGATGFDGLLNPLRGLESMGAQMGEGNQALQQQWQELRLRELDVYHQKLELMQKECELKQDQMKLQIRRNK